ncbi:hypothetical protein AHAS_Ahas17G0167700 [Arachis hypogaea]
MSLNAFATLCELLQIQGGLDKDGHLGIGEQVATFLIILAHHTKNRSVQVRFYRSGETISRYFHKALCSVLRVQSILFAKANPVLEDRIDPRWKWFKVETEITALRSARHSVGRARKKFMRESSIGSIFATPTSLQFPSSSNLFHFPLFMSPFDSSDLKDVFTISGGAL